MATPQLLVFSKKSRLCSLCGAHDEMVFKKEFDCKMPFFNVPLHYFLICQIIRSSWMNSFARSRLFCGIIGARVIATGIIGPIGNLISSIISLF